VALATEIQQRQVQGERVVLVGDFNAFQFSDGYVDVLGILTGAPTADATVMPKPDLVEPNLVNMTDQAPAAGQYSCVFEGNAQQLDHVLMTRDLLPRLAGARYAVARLGADFPEAFYNDGARPERVSDHDAPVAYFSFPSPPAIEDLLATPVVLWPVSHKMVPIRIDYAAADDRGKAPDCVLSVASSEKTDGKGDGRTATDWQVIDAHGLWLRAERSGTGNGRTYTVTVACTDRVGGTSTRSVTVTVPKSQK